MGLNNGLEVYNSFCEAGILEGRVYLPNVAEQIAQSLNKKYATFGLNLKSCEILNKTWQEVHVVLDNYLAARYIFVSSLNNFSQAMRN